MDTTLDVQGCLVGGPPYFRDLEISSYGLITISISYFTLHALLLMFLAYFGLMLIMLNAMLLDK